MHPSQALSLHRNQIRGIAPSHRMSGIRVSARHFAVTMWWHLQVAKGIYRGSTPPTLPKLQLADPLEVARKISNA